MALNAVTLILLQSPGSLEWAWQIVKNGRVVTDSGDTLESSLLAARRAGRDAAADLGLNVTLCSSQPAAQRRAPRHAVA